MAKRIPKNFRTSSSFKVIKLSMTNKKIDKNGGYVDKTKTRKRASIQKGSDLMQQQGMLEVSPTKQTTQRMSHNLLHSIGYTVTISEQEYSLVDSQSADDPFADFLVENIEPIEDMEIMLLDLTKSFPNQFDPIYIADDQEPADLQPHISNMTQQTAESLDLVNVANDFSGLAIAQTNSLNTSRYFNNQQIGIGLKASRM
jgi:hypothetical protein